MLVWFGLGIFLLGPAHGGPIPSDFPDDNTQMVVYATTNEYPGEHSEILVDLDLRGMLKGIIIREYKGRELVLSVPFPLSEINSATGVLIKSELSVHLLRLKGLPLELDGGLSELLYRKSNWSEEYGSLQLKLFKSKHGIWVARERDQNEDGKGPLRIRIRVWKGLGFGIDQLEAD